MGSISVAFFQLSFDKNTQKCPNLQDMSELREITVTTHGSQHFHKQNALKAVAFLSTAESPQLRVDTHIRCAHKFLYVQGTGSALFLVLPF